MAKIIEAKAVISAEDKTGAVFDKIAKKIDGIAKSAKSSAAVDQLSKSLARAQQQMAAIDRFGAVKGGFADARNRFRDAQVAVEAAARAMKRGEGDAAMLARGYEKAQRAASQTAKVLDRQSAAFAAARRELVEMGIPLNRAIAHQERLRAAVEKTNAAVDRQAEKAARSARRREALGIAGAAAGAFVAHEVKSGAGAVLHTYREFDKERRFGKAVMGLSDDEQAPLVAQAIHMGARTKFNDVQVLEAQRELAARGLTKNQVMGMMEPAGQLGMALDLSLPDAARQMEGAIFGFKKDTSTLDAAKRAAQQTADYQVRAAKLSGMTPEDISQLYKFGATPARLGKLSEASLLGFGGILKKANIGGDEAGVAFRALMSTAQAPTSGAKTALLANGLNYKNYQHTPDSLALDPFVQDVAARYGVNLNKGTQSGLAKIFGDKDVIADPAKFAPAVTALLRDQLEGGDAKSLKSIAGAATRYRDKSVNDVDSNAFIKDLLPKLANNLPLANALFGSKQGGRIATALGDGDTLKHIIDEIENHSAGYSEKIASERMAGFDGAVSRLEGAMKNLETAIGRAFDNDGKGGVLSTLTDLLGKFTQGAAEQPRWAIGTEAVGAGLIGGAGAAYSGWKFLQMLTGAGLSASATALDGSAVALSAAAAELSAAAGIKGVPAALAAGGVTATQGAAIAGGAGAMGLLGAGVGVTSLLAVTAALEMARRNGPNMRDDQLDDLSGDFLDPDLAVWAAGTKNGKHRSIWGNVPVPQSGPFDRFQPPTLDATTSSALQSVQVQGTVAGEAKLTVEASSSLIEIVKRAEDAIKLSGTLNGNGPGSAGTSSPDASASHGSWGPQAPLKYY